LLGGGLGSCNDPGFAMIVANDSSREVLVHYLPNDPELPAVAVNSPPGSVALGLGGMSAAGWQGGSIEVLMGDCTVIGRFPIERSDTSIRISADLVATVVEDPSGLSTLDELKPDSRCRS
jgi:hypothetical protein